MKKLLDKLCKINPYIILVIWMCLILLVHLIGILKTTDNTPPSIIESREIKNTVAVAVEVTKEQTVPINSKPEIEVEPNQVPPSRGGLVEPQLTQRQIIQNYVRDISTRYNNIDPYVIMSVIQQESMYNPRATNGKCLGLMQVSCYWHRDRANRLGVNDFYDPYGNILIGVDYISELLNEYGDVRLVLMMYNMNHDTALAMYRNGQISDYATTIITRAEQWKGE